MAEHAGLLELLGALGIVLALAIWELVRLRREQARDRRKALERAQQRASK